jgi:hypothetical protein
MGPMLLYCNSHLLTASDRPLSHSTFHIVMNAYDCIGCLYFPSTSMWFDLDRSICLHRSSHHLGYFLGSKITCLMNFNACHETDAHSWFDHSDIQITSNNLLHMWISTCFATTRQTLSVTNKSLFSSVPINCLLFLINLIASVGNHLSRVSCER